MGPRRWRARERHLSGRRWSRSALFGVALRRRRERLDYSFVVADSFLGVENLGMGVAVGETSPDPDVLVSESSAGVCAGPRVAPTLLGALRASRGKFFGFGFDFFSWTHSRRRRREGVADVDRRRGFPLDERTNWATEVRSSTTELPTCFNLNKRRAFT
jgi:hypothetical protein